MQAWWYLAALDYLIWFIVVLVMGEDRPRIYRIERNLSAERVMLRRAREWWERYLVGDERPPITASETTDIWLKQNHPRERGPAIDQANEEECDLLNEYAVVRRAHAVTDTQRKDLEACIKEKIGDRAGLQWPGGKFTWKLTKDSIHTDWEPLAKMLVERHPNGKAIQEEYTYPKPGVRRIYFKSNRGEEVEL